MSHTICSRCNEKPAAICISCLTDCTGSLKQQPPAGEFTMRFRAYLDGEYRRILLEPSKSMNRPEVQVVLKKQLLSEAKEACNRLDRAEALNKDILPALVKIRKEQKIDPFYLDTLIAIVENAIAGQTISPIEGETDNPDPPPNSKQPPAGEFTKNIRDVLKVMDKDGKFHRKIMEKACDIIDRAEAINKDLVVACEYTINLLSKGIGQTTHALALLEAAIAKAKT